jgi:hypothetical protein
MCADRLMPAAMNLNSRGTVISRIRTDALKRDAVQVQQVGRSQSNFPVWLQKVIDQFDDRVELPYAILGLGFGPCNGIGN